MYYITERYMGKSKTLLEAEQVLGQLITEMKANPLKDYTNHPLNKRLCDLLTKQFGFKKTFIEWVRTAEAAPNAFTLFSCDVLVHPMIRLKASKEKGYYGNGKHWAYIQASSTMPKQLNLTTEEYMAILMHEIGHNFDVSLYMLYNIVIGWIQMVIKALTDLRAPGIDPLTDNSASHNAGVLSMMLAKLGVAVLSTTPIGKEALAGIAKAWEALLDIFPVFKQIGDALNRFISMTLRGIESTFSWMMLLAAPVEILVSPVSHFLTVPTRKSEQFADSFAATYGYATPLATALSKLTTANLLRDKGANESSIRRISRDLTLLNRDIAVTFCGAEHGDTMSRINSNLQYLKSEVNSSSYPAPMKQELLAQIKSLEKSYNDYLNISKDGKYVVAVWARKVINDVFNGRSDFIAKVFPDIKTTWESAESYEDCKLALYESCLKGEISSDTRDQLLELWS